MITFENLEGLKLSFGIRNLSPIQYDTIQVKNKLIDGTYHIQTIGNPLKFLTFEILATHNQVELINLAESRGEDLKLIIDDKYCIGKLDNENSRAEWNRLTLIYRNKTEVNFLAGVRFVISEEGSI